MNLHAVANSVIQAVNPNVPVNVQFSTGSTIAAGVRTPTYASAVSLSAQVQAFTTRNLRQVEGLNLQGTYRAIYLYGDVEVIIRVNKLGGDLLTFPNPVGRIPAGSVWLTTIALETWPDWCKIVAVLQDGS